MLPAIARQVRHARRGFAGIGAAAAEPFAKLAERSGIVVVPLFFIEEWIEVGVRIQGDTDEQLGMLARE